jgi:hypothetical protein
MRRAKQSNTTSKARRADFTVRIERLITPELSKELVKLLLDAGWTLLRIGKTIRADGEFVKRVQAGIQSLSGQDLKALGEASGVDPLRLLFDALKPLAAKSKSLDLYQSTMTLLDVSDTYGTSLRRQVGKKRRAGTKAA